MNANVNTQDATKVPKYLKVGANGVTVTLRDGVTLQADADGTGGIKTDVLQMRPPTIRDVRAAQKGANGDQEDQEIILFASLAGVSTKELERLSVRDYNRVTEGYFRLVQDDDV